MDIKQFTQLFGLALDESKTVKIGKNYYHAEHGLQELRSRINRDVFSLGTYIGCDDGRHFSPSPALIEMISRMPAAEKRKIFVNKKAEGLFLYGRNILVDSITKNPNKIESGYVFIQNEQDENLGYGIFQEQNGQVTIKNLLDKGFYLRKEQKKRR